MTIRIKRDDLLQSARKIFGDIIKAVYADTYMYQYEGEQLTDYISGGMNCRVGIEKEKIILVGGGHLILEFINGSLVSLTCSEYASIGIADKIDVVDPYNQHTKDAIHEPPQSKTRRAPV